MERAEGDAIVDALEKELRTLKQRFDSRSNSEKPPFKLDL
jgi:hypothetical protein